MLVIRLSRIGRKNQPYFRLVLQDQDWSPSSKAIELLGSYNTHTNPPTMDLKTDRIKYWISCGAQTTATVNNMLINAKIIEGKKRRVVATKKSKKEEKKEEAKAKPEEPKKEEPKK